jgi:hypothetical protein
MTPQETNKRNLRLAPFVLTLLCFILPFIQISCRVDKSQTLKVASLTGIQLVTGTEIEQKDPFTGQVQKQKIPSEKWVVYALVCAAAATLLCFVSGAAGKLLPALLGAGGFICMLVVKKRFDDQMLKEGQGLLTIEYGLGFIATCILLLVGAAMCGYHYNEAKKKATVQTAPRPPQGIEPEASATTDRST